MKSVVKTLSFVAMAITFTMSTLVLAETTAPAQPTADATSTPVAKPIVHHKKKAVISDTKAADTATPVVAEKTVASTPAVKPVEPAKTK